MQAADRAMDFILTVVRLVRCQTVMLTAPENGLWWGRVEAESRGRRLSQEQR